jgi:argonaute-like protein implicated in RNA metabolism and viral defense
MATETTRKQIRERLERALDILEARADAFAEQLTLTRQQAAERLEQTKQSVRELLARFNTDLEHEKSLAADHKKKAQAAIEALQVQLALGKAEALDALTEQRKKLGEAMEHFEAVARVWTEEGKQHLDEVGMVIMQQYEKSREILMAELEAATIRAREEAAHQGEILERRRQELLGKVNELKHDIADKRKQQSQKWEQFEKDIKPAIDQAAEAFKKLFS